MAEGGLRRASIPPRWWPRGGVHPVLVVAGMFLRTIVLKFFVGPLIVVGSVALVTPLLSRRRPPWLGGGAHELRVRILARHMDRTGRVWRVVSYLAIPRCAHARLHEVARLWPAHRPVGTDQGSGTVDVPQGMAGIRPYGPSLVAGILASSPCTSSPERAGGASASHRLWSHVLTDTADSVGAMMFFPSRPSTTASACGSTRRSRAATGMLPRTTPVSAGHGTWLARADVAPGPRRPPSAVLPRQRRPRPIRLGDAPAQVPDAPIMCDGRSPRLRRVRGGEARRMVPVGRRLLNPEAGHRDDGPVLDGGAGLGGGPTPFQVASTWGGFAVATIVGIVGTALTAYVAWRLMSRLPERHRSVVPAGGSVECARPVELDGRNGTTRVPAGVERVIASTASTTR